MGTVAPLVRLQPDGWTSEARAEGRKLGQEAVAENAARVREQWADHIVRKLVEDFSLYRSCPTRKDLIDALRDLNFKHGIKGKGGGQVKRSTIARWLAEDVESELRVKAIEELITAAVTTDRRLQK